ncbi:S1 RNA-binding domain-containing protein [Kitasatospora sp. NPDC047058]|uniref:S1 RNA-binding domain-containing protein n=1 Tax=Kitasatospora sp. NPDC047058 TaxID=3155620 RepID=UPI0033D693F2
MSEYSWPWENEKYSASGTASAWTASVLALPLGTLITGEVIGRQPFGSFIAIDGHPDALGLARVNLKPRCLKLPTLGQRVVGEVFYHEEHVRQVGIMLSEWGQHKDLLPSFAERVGQVVIGHVAKIAPIGVFVDLADCVAGLVPLAEFPEPATEAVKDLHEGQEVSVQIVSVDLERQRILLSYESPLQLIRGAR